MKFNFCVACLATDDLHHHHLVARVNGGSDDETNLITLCYSCHRAIHGMKQKSVNHRELVAKGIEKRRAKGLPVGRQEGAIVKSKLDDHADLITDKLNNGTKKTHILEILNSIGVEVTRMSLYRWIDKKLDGKGINKDFHLSKEISKAVEHKERQRAGIERAKAEGKFKGKQVSPKTIAKLKEAMDLLDKGFSKDKAAKEAGISIASLYRHIQELKCKDAERIMKDRLYSPEEAARYSGVTIKVFSEYLSKHNIEVSITANKPKIIEDIDDHFHYLT